MRKSNRSPPTHPSMTTGFHAMAARKGPWTPFRPRSVSDRADAAAAPNKLSRSVRRGPEGMRNTENLGEDQATDLSQARDEDQTRNHVASKAARFERFQEGVLHQQLL